MFRVFDNNAKMLLLKLEGVLGGDLKGTTTRSRAMMDQ